MKNLVAHRTLSDCHFAVGHSISAHPLAQQVSRREQIAGVILAIVLGIVAAAGLWHALAS